MKRRLVFVLLVTAFLDGCGGGSRSGMVSLAGEWAGRFQSSNASFAPFTVSAAITQDSNGNLTAMASFLNFLCLRAATLKGTLSGANVALVGSDSIGDNISLKGTSNSAATQMSLSYTLNASASGKCETDSGTGMLTKQ